MELGRVYFDKYKILETLGQGGTSNVYLAENIKIGNKWAIKKVKIANSSNLLAEPNILKHLDHRSIPKIIDIEEDQESIYIIEEYVDGINLKAFKLQNPTIDINRIIIWVLQLCDVLKYMHGRKPYPIIYRDLKPDNIMLMDEDKIKLIDFGIAREYKEDSENDTVPIGTRGYAAPEQYGIGQSDERTDIFSLGITIYFLLTGKNLSHPPYKIQPFEQQKTGLEEQLFKIVLKCCEILPDRRYQGVDELERDLLAISNESNNISDLTNSNINTNDDIENISQLATKNPCDNEQDSEEIESIQTNNIKQPNLLFNRKISLSRSKLDKSRLNKLNYKDATFNVKKTVTIGVIGVSNCTGVTHTCIMLAQYLSNKGKVAIIELNSSKHFLEICLITDDENNIENKHFVHNKVNFFWDIDYGHFLTLHREQYDFILLDLGSYNGLKGIEEFVRADLRLVVAHGMDWKIKEIKAFYKMTREYDPNNGWKYLLPFMDQKAMKEIKAWSKSPTYPVPYNMNPFVLSQETKKVFEHVLKG